MTKEQAIEQIENLKRYIEEIDKKPSKEQRLWKIINSINRPPLTNDKWPDEIFFFRDDDYLFSYNTKNGSLYCSYDNVWSVFEKEEGMQYEEIKSFIKDLVEKTYKLKGVTPNLWLILYNRLVEKTYKLKGVTPILIPENYCRKVESAFKLKEVTPASGYPSGALKVENTFKLKKID